MDDKLSIKVTIANRQYPLSINRKEEEKIRKAATLINERIKEFGKNYAVRDMQDLLAMAALHFAAGERPERKGDGTAMQMDKVAEIDSLLTSYLEKV